MAKQSHVCLSLEKEDFIVKNTETEDHEIFWSISAPKDAPDTIVEQVDEAIKRRIAAGPVIFQQNSTGILGKLIADEFAEYGIRPASFMLGDANTSRSMPFHSTEAYHNEAPYTLCVDQHFMDGRSGGMTLHYDKKGCLSYKGLRYKSAPIGLSHRPLAEPDKQYAWHKLDGSSFDAIEYAATAEELITRNSVKRDLAALGLSIVQNPENGNYVLALEGMAYIATSTIEDLLLENVFLEEMDLVPEELRPSAAQLDTWYPLTDNAPDSGPDFGM